jgi:hypothetical protein
VSIATYASDALESEVEEFGFEPGFLEEGDEEGAETAVNVKWDLALYCKLGEGAYVVDNAVGEVGR